MAGVRGVAVKKNLASLLTGGRGRRALIMGHFREERRGRRPPRGAEEKKVPGWRSQERGRDRASGDDQHQGEKKSGDSGHSMLIQMRVFFLGREEDVILFRNGGKRASGGKPSRRGGGSL